MSKVALVTGGSRGIGRSIALRLAHDGNAIAVNYAHNADAAGSVVDEITTAGGVAVAFGGDVSKAEDVDELFDAVESKLGAVEILVNNAGITRDDLLLRMKPEAWAEVIATNLTSNYLCSKAALRGMLRARWGRIISIGSVSGIYGNAGQTNYAATKAGVIGFAKSLAKEVGSRNITVNVVAPGFITTQLTAELGDDFAAAIQERIALGRLGHPEEIASAVGYLASDEASYITGQTIVVDGGMSL
jgi:3-oxoacyl-[acyl-carrier protein] reductase